jgi:hypothetical protein
MPVIAGESRAARGAAHLAATAIGVFWALVIVGSLLQPDYSSVRDFVSALASTGAEAPALGVLALVAFGVAYGATAVVLARRFGSVLAAVLLGAAAALTWLVAFARIDCPDGAARCAIDSGDSSGTLRAVSDPGWGPEVHGWAVAASYTCVAVTMAVLVVLAVRRGQRRRVLVSGLALVASLATVPFWALGNDSPGAGQRVWLGILSAWVVLTCLEPRPAVDEQEVST